MDGPICKAFRPVSCEFERKCLPWAVSNLRAERKCWTHHTSVGTCGRSRKSEHRLSLRAARKRSLRILSGNHMNTSIGRHASSLPALHRYSVRRKHIRHIMMNEAGFRQESVPPGARIASQLRQENDEQVVPSNAND